MFNNTFFAISLAIGLALSAAGDAMAASEAAQAVLVVGQPSVTYPGPTDAASTLTRGQSIYEGAVIKTGTADQVNFRFNDDTLVVVRPNSVLVVETYSYNQSAPSETKARYRLEKGVARVVSGVGVQAARDKFRLNTPIAAIGVRGTDFTTSFDPAEAATKVTVAKGEIVMSGFGSGCEVNSLGPCLGQFAEALSEKDSGFALILKQGELAPLRQSSPPIQATAKPASPVKTAESNSTSVTSKPESTKDAVVEQDQVDNTKTAVLVKDPSLTPSGMGSSDPIKQPAQEGPSNLPPTPNQALVWGRWFGGARPGDTITLTREEARTLGGLSREVTVGNSDYILYRAKRTDGGITNFSAVGPMDFKLTGGAAHLINDKVETLSFGNASLKVDFSSALFESSLQLKSASGANFLLENKGVATADGYFFQQGGNSPIAGAVAHDLKSASYFFDQLRAEGRLSGVTQWERKP